MDILRLPYFPTHLCTFTVQQNKRMNAQQTSPTDKLSKTFRNIDPIKRRALKAFAGSSCLFIFFSPLLPCRPARVATPRIKRASLHSKRNVSCSGTVQQVKNTEFLKFEGCARVLNSLLWFDVVLFCVFGVGEVFLLKCSPLCW